MCDGIILPQSEDTCISCRGAFVKVTQPYCLKCGKPVSSEEKSFCAGCVGKCHNFDRCISAFVYDDVMRKSIYRFKYHGRAEYAAYYGKAIYETFKDKIKQMDADALIPVPMHKKKERERGYNQAYLIAKELSYHTNIPVINNVLVREKSTKVMRSLGAKERENNLKRAFKLATDDVKLNNVIIIDDIYTTGSTMDAAAACLREARVQKIYGICLSTGRAQD